MTARSIAQRPADQRRHGIDPDIDKERTKALYDIERTKIPEDIWNAAGDHLKIDDMMAVLELKDK